MLQEEGTCRWEGGRERWEGGREGWEGGRDGREGGREGGEAQMHARLETGYICVHVCIRISFKLTIIASSQYQYNH